MKAWLQFFYSDPEYLHFQEAFDKIPVKNSIEEVVTGPGLLYWMTGKRRAEVGWQFSVWLSANKEKLPTPYLEQVFEIRHSGEEGKPLQPQTYTTCHGLVTQERAAKSSKEG